MFTGGLKLLILGWVVVLLIEFEVVVCLTWVLLIYLYVGFGVVLILMICLALIVVWFLIGLRLVACFEGFSPRFVAGWVYILVCYLEFSFADTVSLLVFLLFCLRLFNLCFGWLCLLYCLLLDLSDSVINSWYLSFLVGLIFIISWLWIGWVVVCLWVLRLFVLELRMFIVCSLWVVDLVNFVYLASLDLRLFDCLGW